MSAASQARNRARYKSRLCAPNASHQRTIERVQRKLGALGDPGRFIYGNHKKPNHGGCWG